MNESFESIINALTDVAQTAANKAKSLTAIAKSNISLLGEQDKLKKAYAELGKLYYRDYITGEEPDDAEYLPLCDRITELVKGIQELRENIDQAKAKPERQESEEELEELKEELADLDEELSDLEEEFADLEEERKELERTREELAAKLAELEVVEEAPTEPAEEAPEEKPTEEA